MDLLLKALGDFTRFRILELLLDEERTQKELLDLLGIDKGVVSGHVEKLLGAGLVARRSPRGKCYLVRPRLTLPVLQKVADLSEALAEAEAREAARRAQRLRQVPTLDNA